MAASNRTAAHDLFANGRWRSCASRAYYAVYCEVTHALLQAGVNMPAGRANPHHQSLQNMIGNNLSALAMATRWRVAGLVAKLYVFRIIADYQPIVTLEEDDARICLGLMTQALQCMRGIP
jgi:uncharacterized protein (UPF0332 family)